jgi:hypothetical protein
LYGIKVVLLHSLSGTKTEDIRREFQGSEEEAFFDKITYKQLGRSTREQSGAFRGIGAG